MRAMPWMIAAAAMLWLSGCATPSAPHQRYTLPGSDAPPAAAGAEAEQVLKVRPPQLAHYLDVDGIVLQLDDITLNEARQHLWAEPLARQLERGLRSRLAVALPDTRVIRDDGQGRGVEALTLRLEIDRFQGRYDGLAIVSGQWQLYAPGGQLLATEHFRVATELADDGYPALVRALGRSWDRVAEQIGEAIRQTI
ncbi:hypothetical protein HOP52_18035 [Halomonas campisalis]|uniref:ABC-type transport auxiliary lipoprotein component domain-containing protein n=1 Tax=Billgrantia campisalis TaxID=74661 RepID=A0ABS9PD06_9GAMM|nr:ABC-type transport auxiliary lipoprotein family protein [Halomonas campisalis]MCG6659652.1 hypothetical protein [Halomonas campisalis]MDR5864607.1 ABC-type transport auxiliary lipoprotein family protein [Halomonas campisalis]